MENNQIVKSNNNKIISILGIVIILLLVVIVALGMVIADKEYKYCSDTKQDKVDEYIDEIIDEDKLEDVVDNCMPLRYDEYDVDLEILSMDEPSIISSSPNHHLYVSGDMKISFIEDNFHVVGLEGYCLGKNNEKYMIYGPASEVEMSFKNGGTVFELVETINDENGDLIYQDGTRKNSGDIDWDNVKIKSCKIERLYTVYTKNGKKITSYTDINYEKQFN